VQNQPAGPPSSATTTADCYGRARAAPAGCTTSPRCAPKASRTNSAPSRRAGQVDSGYQGLHLLV